MKFDKVKDSGVREDMETGSRRDTQVGKSRPDLMNPLVLRRVGMHFANGCDKYGEKNFELGQKSSRYRASLGRHLLDYDEGLKDEDHLAAIIWNAMCIMMNQEFVERGIYDPNLDDFSDYRDKDGFDSTVGKRANAHNDSLRRKGEMDAADQLLLPSEPSCNYMVTGCGDCRIKNKCCEAGEFEEKGTYIVEDLTEDCVRAVYGHGVSMVEQAGDNAQQEVINKIQSETVGRPTAEVDAYTILIQGVAGCAGCMSWDKDYGEWPCVECRRNHDLEEGEKTYDFYNDGDCIEC